MTEKTVSSSTPRGPSLPTLVSGETMIRRSHIHSGVYWKSIVVLVLGLFVTLKVFNLGLLLLVVGALMAGVAWILQTNLLLVLTDRRVIVRAGMLFWVEAVELRLSQIESVEVERMIPGMLMGYGTVSITGTGQRITRIPFVVDPEEFRRAIDEVLLKREGEKG